MKIPKKEAHTLSANCKHIYTETTAKLLPFYHWNKKPVD
jgi:hypothetical protein